MIATSQVERIPSNHEVSRTNPFIHTFSEKKLSKRDRVRARNRTFAGMPWPSGFSVRSEEHTSELQSLMRISYAVFCLKKKKRYHTLERISIDIELQKR